MRLTKPIQTSGGQIIPLSFREFTKRVQVNIGNHHDPDEVHYNSLITYGVFGGSAFFEPEGAPGYAAEEETTYLRCKARLIEGPIVEAAHQSLMEQVSQHKKYFHKLYKDMGDLLEDFCVESLMEHGVPDFAVRLGKRLWMVANPDDFRIHRYDGRFAMACNAFGRTKVYSIDKMTCKDVENIVNSWDIEKMKKESGLSE